MQPAAQSAKRSRGEREWKRRSDESKPLWASRRGGSSNSNPKFNGPCCGGTRMPGDGALSLMNNGKMGWACACGRPLPGEAERLAAGIPAAPPAKAAKVAHQEKQQAAAPPLPAAPDDKWLFPDDMSLAQWFCDVEASRALDGGRGFADDHATE